jgi:hypothetical protein
MRRLGMNSEEFGFVFVVDLVADFVGVLGIE